MISRERIAGLPQTLAQADTDLPEGTLYVHSNFMSAGGYVAACRLLDLQPEQRLDAIFCCNDLMAIGI